MKEECTYIIIEETSMDYYGFDIFFSIDLYRFFHKSLIYKGIPVSH